MKITHCRFFNFFCQGFELKTSTTNINARGLGDPSLLQSYFVCVTESKSSTLIEYGKTLGTTQSGDVFLNMLDLDKPLNARFYAFGNGKKEADIIDAHIVARDHTKAECKGDTFMDLTSKLCTQHCHEDCDPLYGKRRNSTSVWDVMSCKKRCVFLVLRCHALLCDK